LKVTYGEWVDFLEHRMRMSHIYQPLLIQTLIDADGTATVRQIAQAFLAQDESKLRYYEQRIKQIPMPILKRHGIVKAERDVIKLAVKDLTYDQKVQLRMLCQQKLHEFVARRGLAVWDHRMLEIDPIPDSLHYIALKDSGGRRALCDATRNESPLDIDHNIPAHAAAKTSCPIYRCCAHAAIELRATAMRPTFETIHHVRFTQRIRGAGNAYKDTRWVPTYPVVAGGKILSRHHDAQYHFRFSSTYAVPIMLSVALPMPSPKRRKNDD
jgi:hypothetical protein